MTALRFPRGLYGVTPDWPDTDRLLSAIRLAHAGGMRALQWRRKTGDAAQRQAQAQAVLDLCRLLGLPLIINDDWQLAAQLDADGVHLGRDDAPAAQVRQALGPHKLIGCSCYNQPDLARRQLQASVDYIAFGAVYPSRVKPDAVQATLADLRAGRQLTQALSPRPAVVAIGGITPENAAPLIQAGVDSIAVISAIFDAPDIQAAAQACSRLFS
ncbi:thiamine phosphate synthase [Castellaniella hirudinis]|uniref:thiamine phosphate synthase n=1 Tax=Castellaniella hirudinis TaxID=1144617 RepID=UPI0039C1E70F